MRKLLSSALLLAVVVPSFAQAQQRRAQRPAGGAKHEFGVDVGAGYMKPEGLDGGIVIFTPVDVRVGFVSAKDIQWEGRLALGFSTLGGETAYALEPGVNVVYAMAPGTQRSGMYLTGGGAVLLEDDGANNGTRLSVNGAVGWRKPSGTAALRYEVGFTYFFESQDLGRLSAFLIGGRVGLSLWK